MNLYVYILISEYRIKVYLQKDFDERVVVKLTYLSRFFIDAFWEDLNIGYYQLCQSWYQRFELYRVSSKLFPLVKVV